MASGRVAGLFILGVVGSAAAAPRDAPDLDAERIKAGEIIYRQYCASCHGEKAEGQPRWQQPNERGELPAPPHDSSGHTWRHADAELYEMISEGWRDPFNKTETLTMPAFAGELSPRGIVAVITYLKTLWSPEQRMFQSERSEGRPFPADAGQ